jgi:arsenate reductase
MITLYGIPNCDTVKKARKWLEMQHLDYQFHDFRKDGVDSTLVAPWLQQVDSTVLLNRRSTTWKQLSDADKSVTTDDQLISLLVANPTLIKRPVIDCNGAIIVGFTPDRLNIFLTEQSGK